VYVVYLCFVTGQGKNHCIKVLKKSFEKVAKLKYLRMTVTNQKCTHKQIKSRLNLGNACYCASQNILFSHPSKTVKIIIYKTVILLHVLYECETWSFTLKEVQRLRVSENRVLRRIRVDKKVME
jgi:hypothetical protein